MTALLQPRRAAAAFPFSSTARHVPYGLCRYSDLAGTDFAPIQPITRLWRRKMIRLIGAFLILQVISGCATAPQQHWYNSSLDNQVINSRFVIDRGECQSMALQRVPPPRPAPTYNGYTSQVEMTSSSGQSYFGQITTQPTAGAVNDGFYQGYLRAQVLSQANQARENLYNSCMYQRGWELR